jgi:hypothetical protein
MEMHVKYLLLIIAFMGSVCSALDKDMAVLRLGGQVNLVGQEGINQLGYDWRPAWGLEAGIELAPWTLGVQWRHLNMESETGSMFIKTKQDRLWLLVRRQWETNQDWFVWMQAASGLEWAEVKSRLMGETETVQSDPELAIGAGFGLGWPLASDWRSEMIFLGSKIQTRSALEASASVSLVRLF